METTFLSVPEHTERQVPTSPFAVRTLLAVWGGLQPHAAVFLPPPDQLDVPVLNPKAPGGLRSRRKKDCGR